MSEQFKPSVSETRAHQEILDEAVDDDVNLFQTISRARTAGIDSARIKEYALRVMAADFRRGRGHADVAAMIHRIAANSGVATPEEIDVLLSTVVIEEAAGQTLNNSQEVESDPVQAAIDKYGYGSIEHQMAAWDAYENGNE